MGIRPRGRDLWGGTPEDVLNAAALAEERIDYWTAWWHKWSLEEEAEQ